jgi:hypothetical protein
MVRFVLLSLLLMTPALAQNGTLIPNDTIKVWLLQEAYRLNGNSMVRWGCIDMSGVKPVPCVMPVPAFDLLEPDRPSGGHH